MDIAGIHDDIESKCEWLRRDAAMLDDLVARIPCRREYTTRGEAAMDAVEKHLIAALQSVRRTRRIYLSKEIA